MKNICFKMNAIKSLEHAWRFTGFWEKDCWDSL
jgi:hypothetical protein